MLKAIPLWLRIGFLLVVMVSAFLLWQAPKWRVNKALKQADVMLAERDFEGARKVLSGSLERDPGTQAVALRLSEVLRAIDPERSFDVLLQLHQANRLPAEAYADAIIQGYEVGRLDDAKALAQVAEERGYGRLSGVRAVEAVFSGDFARARELFEETLALHPEWERFRFLRGQLMRRSPAKVDQLRAKEDLLMVSESPSLDGVRALMALINAKNFAISTEDKMGFVARVVAHPWATPRFRILAYHLAWTIDEASREKTVETAVADLKDTNPVLLAEWLNAIGEHDQALAVVPESSVGKSSPEAFEQRFRALALGGHLAEAEELVLNNEAGESALQNAARLFVVSLRPNNSEEAVERWNDAYALARQEDNVGVQYFLARSALRLGYLTGAIQAYKGLFDREEFADAAAESVWTEYFTAMLATGSVEDALKILKQAYANYPESVSLVNNLLYLELLVDGDWQDTFKAFSRLAPAPEATKDLNGVGSTWVLATLKQGQPEKAYEILRTIETANPDQAVSDSTKIVKALVLSANQQFEAALQLCREVDRNRVLPAEWALVASLTLSE